MGPPTNSNESYCTFTLSQDITAGGLPSQDEIAKDLESNDPMVKRHAVKAAIMAMLGGESMPRILMQVIRFCINSQDKPLKKLCMLYWEVVPKYQPDSQPRKMLPEMLLVCNALMKDLTHPNEYVRGSMLRFLCKVKDVEILQPLMPSIVACLEHRHQYVRKNAVMAIYHAHRVAGDVLMPDAPERIAAVASAETDVAARRNCYLMLLHRDREKAIEYLGQHVEEVSQSKFGDGFALLVLELTRRVCRADPVQKSRFVRVLFAMLSSPSPAVSYEAAWTLVSLSNAPTAVRAASSTYAELLVSQNDNNVKLIVLERLEEMVGRHPRVLQEVLMDLLRALASPNLDVRAAVLRIAMEVVSGRNVTDLVKALVRQVTKSLEADVGEEAAMAGSYRVMLVEALHGCATRFPVVAETVIHTLLDLLTEDTTTKVTVPGQPPDTTTLTVVTNVRAIVEQYPEMRPVILEKLLSNLGDVSTNSVMCVCLWILGEYCNTPELLTEAFETIVGQIGEPNFLSKPEKSNPEDGTPASEAPKIITKNVVLADGTYATQTIYSEPKETEAAGRFAGVPNIRRMLMEGDVFLGSILASSLTKICLRASDSDSTTFPPSKLKDWSIQSLLIMCALVKMAEGAVSPQKSSLSDSKERIALCCRVLLDPTANALLKPTLLTEGKATFSKFLASLAETKTEISSSLGGSGGSVKKANAANTPTLTQADDLIHFRQLSVGGGGAGFDLDDGSDLVRATGASDYNKGSDPRTSMSRELSHVYQLSGTADPVYAEATVLVNDYDISLELLVINRTSVALSNLTVELNTMGDMEVVERPQTQDIAAHDQATLRASIKVSSTETGHIFGTICYEDSVSREKGYIHLNDIHMDIMDYIRPATCTDETFRSMWAEFEWENKVAISTTIDSLPDFLNHVVKSTKMCCLTEKEETHDDENGDVGAHKVKATGNFLAANLYAKSVFGEDALVNVSVEKKADNDGKLAGYIRIRSKTQGIALSLGDRITTVQRGYAEQ